MTARPSLSDRLRHALDLLLANKFDAWADLYADDGVHEFPFAPPDRPTRIEGRAAVGAYMGQMTGRARFEAVHDLVIHEATDANTVIAEFRMTGRRLATNTPLDTTYIW